MSEWEAHGGGFYIYGASGGVGGDVKSYVTAPYTTAT